MTEPSWPGNCRFDGIYISCHVVRLTPCGLVQADVVNSGDGVLLLVGMEFPDDEGNRATFRTVSQTVEVWRGDRLRHRLHRRFVLESGRPRRDAFEIFRSQRAGSARLVCRLLIDGTEVARIGFLEGRLDFDAQGRFDAAPQASTSTATSIAFQNQLAKLLRSPGGNGRIAT